LPRNWEEGEPPEGTAVTAIARRPLSSAQPPQKSLKTPPRAALGPPDSTAVGISGEKISTVGFDSDPTAYNGDPREGVSANHGPPRGAVNFSLFLFFELIDRLCAKLAKFISFANNIPLERETCELFFCTISFICYRTNFLSNLKLL
jgi:hypothetical protein